MKTLFPFTQRLIFLKFTIITFILIGCKCNTSEKYSYRMPDFKNDGFNIGTLEEVNIDSLFIQKAVDDIKCGKYEEVHSMLIYKDEKLVFEEYFPGHKYDWEGSDRHGEFVEWDYSTAHEIMSVSKSITSTLIGIAIEKGFIKSIHQSIFDYLPDYQHLKTTETEKITIEHLLTMTSGLEWNEWGEPYDIIKIWFQDKDPISFILDRPLIHKPGSTFTYSGGNTIILGEIIKNATTMDIDKFSKEYLFKPLDISSFDWAERFDNGVIETGGGLELTPRDMMKMGLLYLNKGVFNNQQVISQQWIEKSIIQYSNNKNIDISGHNSGIHAYSYSWWLKTLTKSGKEIKMYHAVGWGGQEIILIPDLNTVVVFTGGNYTSDSNIFEILEDYIIPSIN